MTAEADEVHCDSLSGAAMGSQAVTVPPSLRPEARRAALERYVGYALASLALSLASAAILVSIRHTPEVSQPDALQVDGQTVRYSAGFAARAGIRTVEVEEASFSPVITVAGKTSFDPGRVAAVGARALGTVRRVAKYEGDSVKRGEVLAEIVSPLSARMEAAASLKNSRAPHKILGVFVLRSPLEGTVIERRIVTGQSVRGERVAFIVANLDRLLVDVAVDQSQAQALHVGDRVELSRDAAQGAATSGNIAAVEPVSAAAAAAGAPVVVHLGFDNHARLLMLGQAVTARIFATDGARAVVIPNRAVAWIAGRPSVFVSDGHNSASAATVTLGGCNGEQTEVQSGLAAGQHIVSDGVRTLKDESFL